MSDKVTYRCPTCGFQTLTIDNDGRFVCMMAHCAAPHRMDQLVETVLWIRSMRPTPSPSFLVQGAGEQEVQWDQNGHGFGVGIDVPSGTAGGGGGNLSTMDYLNQTIMSLRNTVNDQAARIAYFEQELRSRTVASARVFDWRGWAVQKTETANSEMSDEQLRSCVDELIGQLCKKINDIEPKLHHARKEIADAREACPSIRQQDNFDKSLLELINLEVGRGFKLDSALGQVQANSAKALAEKDEEIERQGRTIAYLNGLVRRKDTIIKSFYKSDDVSLQPINERLENMINDLNRTIDETREMLAKKPTSDGGLDNTEPPTVEMREVDRSMFIERLNALKKCNDERAIPCRVCGMSINRMLRALELEVPLTAPDGRNLVSALRKLAEKWNDDADRARNDITADNHGRVTEAYMCGTHAKDLLKLIGGER